MRGHTLVIILLCAAQACVFGAVGLARAEDQPAPAAQSSPVPVPEPSAAPGPEPQPSAQMPSGAPAAAEPQPPETAQAPASADPVVASIRSKLSDPAIRKDANTADLAALEAFYATRPGALWVTEMGFSARAQAALFEIGEAEDWGLDPAAFELPPADALPRTPEEQAIAEIKLDLAILKYARFAQGRTPQPAGGEWALRPSAVFARSQDRARRGRSCRGARCLPPIAAPQARAVPAPAQGSARGTRQERGGARAC